MSIDSRPLVLILDDDPGVALLQRRRLERANYRAVVATTVDEATSILEQGSVDLILMDYRLSAAISGLDFHRRMQAAGSDVPVIMVSAAMSETSVVEALRAGVRDVLIKSTEFLEELPAVVRAVLKQGQDRDSYGAQLAPRKVLVVDDDAEVAALEQRRLERAGYQVLVAASAQEAVDIVRTGQIVLAILDLHLPNQTSGFDLYAQLRAEGWEVPSILVTAYPDEAVAIRALRAGFRDFISKSDDYLEYLPVAVERVISQLRAERKLAESELRCASIIGTTLDAVVMCDEAMRIILFNRAAEEMFSCSADDAMLHRIDRFLPEFHEELDDEATKARRHIETVAVTATGKRLPVEIAISENAAMRRKFVTIIARDVSERHRIEAQLREADRRKDEFLGMLAHELRNPLAAIMNATEGLTRTTEQATAQKLTGVMKRQTHALARMVDDLLDVSRVTLGKIQLNKEPLLLEPLISRTFENVVASATASRIQLSLDVEPESMWIEGDVTRLEQILVNLLNNAVKFTPAGGQVTVSLRREGSHAMIRVEDTGVGMAPTLLSKVFDLFVQGDTSLDRAKSGLGIGLALVRQLVQLHGGDVEAQSEGLGKGSTFIVRLPLASNVAGLALVDRIPPATDGSKHIRLLVVDDQKDVADSVTMLLTLEGYEARAAYEAKEALAIARAEPQDVMLIDVGMPGMNGYQLAQSVRSDPDLASIRLIAMTGYGREQDLRQAAESGFDRHLTKPVSLANLLSALQAS